ncbi:DUF1315 family protein [Alteromonas aestuariivivens]|uniref:DUF1315 family protein n=1 Tax=Alteromonas aestuariivivens TaxID=1938339 RepID=A0A3D8MA02_9ALTE|nr:DUF1315 family protein [Alteromonas aestuariivivens]RDV26140.1 DUF1315 family protein [Alteromonas aestuariivivens]
MNIEQLLAAMTPEVYERLKLAVETGKWLDGSPLSEEQKAHCLQAVFLYQSKIAKSTEHMTVGEDGQIVHKSKRELKAELNPTGSQSTIARFKQDDF